MKRLDLTPIATIGVITGLSVGIMSLACGTPAEEDGGNMDSGLTLTTGITTGVDTEDDSAEDTGPKLDAPGGTGVNPGCSTGDVGCTDQIDLLFVIDNSGTMGEEQINLAVNFPLLIEQLENLTDSSGMPVNADVQIMVTTTDFGNPLCTAFKPVGYDPAQGAPLGSGCNSRIGEFTDFDGIDYSEACTTLCPADVAPSDSWVHVVGAEANVPMGAVVEALQCLIPQGVVGCGFESPLENLIQALNPSASWNQEPSPFMRSGADLMIILLTDELDCSVQDYSIMADEGLMNINPNTGFPSPSSAICRNAGVSCDGPDAGGLFTNCGPTSGSGLHDIERYTAYLVDFLVEEQGKEVMMIALTGVPEVLSHAPQPPFEPEVGGIDALLTREWIGFPYPAGDVIPEEWKQGLDGADKIYAFGDLAPGCTVPDAMGRFSQGLPPLRIQAVCQALDTQGSPHCCMESICDTDYEGAMRCLRGMVEVSLAP